MTKTILSYPVINHLTDAQFAAEVFETPWKGHYYDVPPSLGDGKVEAYDFDFFSVMISRFKFKEPAKIERLSSDLKGCLIFGFILNGTTSHFKIQYNNSLGRLQFGAHVSTPSTASIGEFKEGMWHRQVSILVKKDWLEDYLQIQLPARFSDTDNPLFVFPEMTVQIAKVLNSLYQSDLMASLRKKQVELKCKEALLLTTEKLILDAPHYGQQKYHPEELNKVLQISAFLSQHLDQNFTVKEISDQFFINKDKLQLIFKSIFGVSVAKFLKQSKMELAYVHILNGISVSEAGYMVGYSNLSHFARAFKSIYGLNPSEVNKIK